MGQTIPGGWKGLPARQRDVLLSLMVDGPATGIEAHERIMGETVYQSKNNTYRALDELRDADLVAREKVDGRTYQYQATPEGLALVEAVAERWRGVAGV